MCSYTELSMVGLVQTQNISQWIVPNIYNTLPKTLVFAHMHTSLNAQLHDSFVSPAAY